MQKFLILNLIALMTCLSPLKLSAQPKLNASKVDRNVVYGMYSGLALLMDVYYPKNPNGYGIIHISGGRWTRPLSLDAGMLKHSGFVKVEGEMFVEAGFTLFSVNHRAVPRFSYPAAVEDVQRAVRFIRYHAEKYKINPDKIGAVGGSSGGHLVSMLGVLDGNEVLADETPINKMSAKVQCVIARAAPTSFVSGLMPQLFLGIREKESKNPLSAEYKIAYEASPIFHVTADDPPFLLVHGDKDESVPFVLSENMYKKLQELNVPAKLITVEGGGHGPGFSKLPEVKKEMVKWMEQHLKKR